MKQRELRSKSVGTKVSEAELRVIFLSLAVVSMCTGKAYSGYGGWARRAKEPAQFWGAVVVLGLGASICVAIYAHSVFPEPIFHPERWLRLK
jgi:hypothetical protein